MRGLLSPDPAVLSGLARVTQPAGIITAVLSVTPRDEIPGLDILTTQTFVSLTSDYASRGLNLVEARPATATDLAQTRSLWTKRLGAYRPMWALHLRRG